MKKLILVLAAVCAALCCLTACNSVGYDDLNLKIKLNYSAVTLTVIDKYDANTSLISNYYMEFSEDKVTVNYGIERFTEISLEKPSEFVKPVLQSGTAVIKNGVVVSGALDVSGVLPDGFEFKKEYFENAELTKSSFFADVKEAAAFLGTEITCTHMKVSASFGKAFNSITVTYTGGSGNNVEYRYAFGALA